MTIATECIYETGAVPNAETTAYTSLASGNVRTLLDKFTGYGVAACTLTIKLVPSGGSAAAANVLAVKNFAAGESYTFPELVGHTLMPGDFISILASVASAANLRISGRKVT